MLTYMWRHGLGVSRRSTYWYWTSLEVALFLWNSLQLRVWYKSYMVLDWRSLKPLRHRNNVGHKAHSSQRLNLLLLYWQLYSHHVDSVGDCHMTSRGSDDETVPLGSTRLHYCAWYQALCSMEENDLKRNEKILYNMLLLQWTFNYDLHRNLKRMLYDFKKSGDKWMINRSENWNVNRWKSWGRSLCRGLSRSARSSYWNITWNLRPRDHIFTFSDE